MLAAIAARGPELQIVTIGRSSGRSGQQVRSSRYGTLRLPGMYPSSRSSRSRTSTTIAPASRRPSRSATVAWPVVSGPAPRTKPATSRKATEWSPVIACCASSAVRATTVTAAAASRTKPAFVEKLAPETGTLIAPWRCPARCSATGRTSRSCEPRVGSGSSAARGCAATKGPRFSSTIRVQVRRLRRRDRGRRGNELVELGNRGHGVEAPLEADRRRASRAHGHTAQGPRDVPGEDLDAVGELEKPAQRVEEALGALGRADREIGSRRVAHEERVAGQDEPRLVGARRIDDGETAVLGTMPRRVDAPERDGPHHDHGSVLEWVARIVDPRLRMDAHRYPVLEGEAAVARDVVRVGMRLERPYDTHVEPRRLVEHGLDRVGRVDDHGDAGLLAADEVRGAPEIVVQDLREEHRGPTVATGSAIPLEVDSAIRAGAEAGGARESSRRSRRGRPCRRRPRDRGAATASRRRRPGERSGRRPSERSPRRRTSASP